MRPLLLVAGFFAGFFAGLFAGFFAFGAGFFDAAAFFAGFFAVLVVELLALAEVGFGAVLVAVAKARDKKTEEKTSILHCVECNCWSCQILWQPRFVDAVALSPVRRIAARPMLVNMMYEPIRL